MSEDNSPIQDPSFTQFADAYLALHRSGEAPSLDRMVREFPHLANDIRERLPALMVLEQALGNEDSAMHPCSKDAEEPAEGSTVAGCIIKDEIGRGACGIVYRANQVDLGREIAIKVISLKRNTWLPQRFSIESQALAKLEHPNIVPVYGFSEDANHAFLLMKLITGYSIASLLETTPDYKANVLLDSVRNDWLHFAEIARDLSSALAHAHSRGLIHRDIKPSNIMLDTNGKVWLTDFGLAKMHDYSHSLTNTGEVIGTLRYMSPEQLRGESDARSDIYSLGLTLQELARSESTPSDEHGDLPETMPSGLKDVLSKCCALAPESRYQTADELQLVFQRFLDGQTPDRRRKKRLPDAEFRRKSRQRMVYAGIPVAISFCGLIFWMTRPTNVAAPQDSGSVLEHLAAGSDASVPEIIRQVTRNSFAEAGDELGMSDSARKDVIAEVDEYVDKLASGEIPEQSLFLVQQRYSDSGWSLATQIMFVNQAIDRSDLPDTSKVAGHDVVRKLALLIGSGKIEPEIGQSLLAELTESSSSSFKDLRQLRVEDPKLDAWLYSVSRLVTGLDASDIELKDELKKLFAEPSIDEMPMLPTGANLNSDRLPVSQDEIQRGIQSLPPELQQRALQELQRFNDSQQR